MAHPEFDRNRLFIKGLGERKNQISIKDKKIPLTFQPENLKDHDKELIHRTALRISESIKEKRSVILAFGAHTIKNGLGPVLIELMRKGWVTHLATNGAGIIHDWEFAFQGLSGEDVRENVKNGQFGIWEETGLFINLAIAIGAYEKLGYGESVGKMISREGLSIPEQKFLTEEAVKNIKADPGYAAAANDLYDVIKRRNI